MMGKDDFTRKFLELQRRRRCKEIKDSMYEERGQFYEYKRNLNDRIKKGTCR